LAKLEEKIKALENRPTATPERTFANVVSHGLPPRPERPIFAHLNKLQNKELAAGKNMNVGKLARAAREILAEFIGPMKAQPSQETADRAYRELNQAMINSDLKRRPFM
jgi:hypothetical protein